MKCPTTNKLAEWFDQFLPEKEHAEIKAHIEQCQACSQVIASLQDEQAFLKETLETPMLPDTFADEILTQLAPYESKKPNKKKIWRKVMLPAAAAVLALGITSTLHPSFAQWIGGFFSTEQVDEGLRMASEAGLAERVNQEVTDSGLTLRVEDVLADSTRVALSYQIVNENGKILDPYLELDEQKNFIRAYDQDGNQIEGLGMGWSDGSEYGLIEFSLREIPAEKLERLTIQFKLQELNGRKGNWELELPVDLTESKKMTTTLTLHNQKTSSHGVEVHLKEVQYATSSNEIRYSTDFTETQRKQVEARIQSLEKDFGEEKVHTFSNYGTAIQYHIENEAGETLYQHNAFVNQGHPSDLGLLQGTGRDMEQLGHMEWNESFVPQKEEEQLTFVLDGVIKTLPSDFSIKIKPKELKRDPLTFEHKGNYLTIKKAKTEKKYSLRKALIPIQSETIFKIEMEGGKEVPSVDLGSWVVVDDKGEVYQAYHSGSILDEKDEHGRFKTTTELTIYGMEETPDELTLHLLSETHYESLAEPWEVPLEENE
ncbi:DUF4179 domain-containing protein [Mesobacillus maritimus]|uniref:DUF4179 domain-containing protein n=1 Tax=Mesobacillus maritimus TaxID=1643336 RepID=UPI0020421C1E|nr:DUF4179 domain-containing protein [Mesobacillus maritimus]MCM3667951.1 DUF4179 domain-containing protein [Mesobacillus maritimus]